jgi:hypothetical protein
MFTVPPEELEPPDAVDPPDAAEPPDEPPEPEDDEEQALRPIAAATATVMAAAVRLRRERILVIRDWALR